MRGHAPQSDSFQDNPLAYLDIQLQNDQEIFWISERELCVGNPEISKAVLANSDNQFTEHSDFFRSRHGFLQPRELQQSISRDAATVLSQYIKQHHAQLPQYLAKHCGHAQEQTPSKVCFPDAANRLMLDLLGPALVRPGSAPAVEKRIAQITQRAILRGRGLKPPPPTGFWFRLQVIHQLGKEIQRRARNYQQARQSGLDADKTVAEQAQDLLDVIAFNAGPSYPSDQLAQVFLSFIVASISSIGFLFAWSLYLLGRHQDQLDLQQLPPRHIVLEALRLWPIAWLFGRQPQQDCQIGEHQVRADQDIVVCPYLSQRSERYWERATEFIPQRWNDTDANRAFLPFGWGEHRCTASGLSIALVSDLLQVLLHDYRLQFHFEGAQACVGVALSPPYFELELAALRSVTYSMRNTVCKGFSAQC